MRGRRLTFWNGGLRWGVKQEREKYCADYGGQRWNPKHAGEIDGGLAIRSSNLKVLTEVGTDRISYEGADTKDQQVEQALGA